MTTLTDYLIKLSEDKNENEKYTNDQEAALAGSGLSEEHMGVLRGGDREKIKQAILEETPNATIMPSFMVSHVVKSPSGPFTPDPDGKVPIPHPQGPPEPPNLGGGDDEPKWHRLLFWRRR